tara:strand:+ start:1218 stop:1799 length:582 start_codon:yes stop_codon:yes gene_type:complete
MTYWNERGRLLNKWKTSIAALLTCCLLASPGEGSDLLEELFGIQLFSTQELEDGEAGYGLFIRRRQSEIRPLFDFGLGVFPPPGKDQAHAAVVIRVKRSPGLSEEILGSELTREIARFTDETEDLFFRVITGITGQHTFYTPKATRTPTGAAEPTLAQPSGAVRNITDEPVLPSPPVPETDPTALLPDTTKKR